jgi:hypothetical protein
MIHVELKLVLVPKRSQNTARVNLINCGSEIPAGRKVFNKVGESGIKWEKLHYFYIPNAPGG